LYIGGACLARGYLGRPDLTAGRFIPNPHASSLGERLYDTGDLARFREDGNIEFLGRGDHQVKIRGFRIELGEVEAHLREHPAVLQVIATAREDTPGNNRLVAYIVLNSPEQISAGDLRNFLSIRLPDYMVPSAIVLLEQMPLMSNGKVDRGALPVPEYTRDETQQPYTAPRNDAEVELAAIFREVLGVEMVGIDDNFFRLGGHSLSATRVMVRIRDAFHIDVPLRNLFETPTIAGLAAVLDKSEPMIEQDEPIEIISRQTAPEQKPLTSMLDDLSKEDLESLLAELAARKKK
ncbi:MAG: phosphopantetheine-binding protein, partial [Blastocatellia bacterium]